ncbi:MAG TPA: MFS transporter [Acidimicrobiales bacterium]|nr:MFS transporter [Acidimicrobiales bacterium]
MSSSASWEPVSNAERRAGPPREFSRRLVIPPFTWLARTHAAAAMGDASVAISLAGSLFFDISPQAARSKVALYLLLTMVPFAVVAPLLGPAIDRARGGRRLMVILSCAGRAAAAAALVLYVDTLWLFLLALLFLVFAKAYAVSKSALVPTVVTDEAELVEANSKLGLLAGIAGFVVVLPAVLLKLIDVRVTLCLAVLMYLVALAFATRLRRDVVAATPAGEAEREELRSAGVVLAASGMAIIRATVGFLTFQLAFLLRSQKASVIWFGGVLLFSAIGTMVGNVLGPILRRSQHEERMLALALAIIAVGGLIAATGGGQLSAMLLAGSVGVAASFARLAFDAIVQRDAPDANRGRAFAQFETKFQIAWVLAAFLPVIFPIPRAVGFLFLSILATAALVSYIIGWRRIRAGQPLPPSLTDRVRSKVKERRHTVHDPEDLPPPDPGARL